MTVCHPTAFGVWSNVPDIAGGRAKENCKCPHSAILKQHDDAQASWKQTFSEQQYAKMIARSEVLDAPLEAALKMVQGQDEDAISSYLADNYMRNCTLAKFCMR